MREDENAFADTADGAAGAVPSDEAGVVRVTERIGDARLAASIATTPNR
jgi:hypothetical protein